MDPYAQGGMIFTVIMTLIIGGFIVTFPILRRLGRVMEETIRDRQEARLGRGNTAMLQAEVDEIKHAVGRIEGHLELLGERQDFVENLLSHRDPKQLPDHEGWQG